MQLISPAERRITLRLLSYWERLRGSRDMPATEDITPEDLHDLWGCCFMLVIRDEDYHYTYIGEEITRTLHGEVPETGGSEIKSEQINHLTKNYMHVVLTRKPVLEEGEFHNVAGGTLKYRQCLLPLGHEGQVRAVLGAVRFKLFH